MIYVPVSVGELLDKIIILVIKMSKITDAEKRINIDKELTELSEIWKKHKPNYPMHLLVHEQTKLHEVNKTIWELEDRIRRCMKYNSYGSDFVNLTREVHELNEERAALKREINKVSGSSLIEEKNYGEV